MLAPSIIKSSLVNLLVILLVISPRQCHTHPATRAGRSVRSFDSNHADDGNQFLDSPTISTDPPVEVDSDGFAIDEGLADLVIGEGWPELSTTARPLAEPETEKPATGGSSIEPLMLYSDGVSIKGYWMRSKIRFDVATVGLRPTKADRESLKAPGALRAFLSVLGMEPIGSSTSAYSSEMVKLAARSTIVGVDMDPATKEVYWVESGKDAGVFSTVLEAEQYEHPRRGQFKPQPAVSKYSAVVDSGLFSPEDLALDLVAGNVYITDAGLPAIVVCTIRLSHCRILIKDRIHKPRSIIVDSTTGWLTYTDWGDHAGIFMATMDGKRRETLIESEAVWPNALAADHAGHQLYWADAHLNKIERIDLTTRKRYTILREHMSPFSLTQFEDHIYWSDWAGNDVKTCDKMTGNSTKVILSAENVYGIHIYHPEIAEKSINQENPCWSMHCSHMCLLSPVPRAFDSRKEGAIAASCACPDSMALSAHDHATCYETDRTSLLVNANNYVARMFPERIGLQVIEKVISSKNHSISDIASDWYWHRLFFFDSTKMQIFSVGLRAKQYIGTEHLVNLTHKITGLTYDSLSDNLFWIDPDLGTLSMCPVRGKFEISLRKGLDRPTSLVLDEINRVLYIALAGKIIRADLLGNDKLDLTIVGKDISAPVALHLDETQQRLYWADSVHETIESIDLDAHSFTSGVKHDSRIVHRHNMGHVLAFVVHHDSLLWTIKNSDYLYKAKLLTHKDVVSHLVEGGGGSRDDRQQHPITYKLPEGHHHTPSPSKMIIVRPRYDARSMACNFKDCKHGCVLDAKNSASCICPNSNNLEFCEDVERRRAGDASMVWLIVLLLLLSITGLITLASLLTLYRQGRIPTQVSQFSVSFISPNRNKDGAMLLLDTEDG